MGANRDRGDDRQISHLTRQIRDVKATPQLDKPPSSNTSATVAGWSTYGTRDLLDLVVASGFEGAAWRELERRLVVRAVRNLSRSIQSGTIYGRCAGAGVALQRRSELQIHPLNEHIAAEAIDVCLHRFITRVLPEGQWDPDRGISLEDFFLRSCLWDLANRWRWHARRLPERSVSLNDELNLAISILESTSLGPEERIGLREQVEEALADMRPEDQYAFSLMANGWSREEIANELGVTRNALDARVSRARKAAQARRTP